MDFAQEHWLRAHAGGVPRRPVRVLAGYFALSLPALGLGFAAGLVWSEVLVAPVSLALAGAVHSGRRWIELLRRRREADRWLRQGLSPGTLHGWRVAELTSPRERQMFARSLRSLIRELDMLPFLSASPLNRPAVRPYVDELQILQRRLASRDRPVAPLGMLLVRELLADGGSPLYDRGSEDQLPAALERIHDALDTQPWRSGREGQPCR